MIVVDRALAEREREGRPVGVGIVGAGFMGRALTRQIIRHVPGMDVVGVASRRADDAARAFADADVTDAVVAEPGDVARRRGDGDRVATTDAHALCDAPGIDVVVEATGTVEFAASVVLAAIDAGKHVVLLNAEVDGTLGPVLKRRADAAGVVYTSTDGDQPGTELNLVRFVRGVGLTPLVVGNIKGLYDPYRTPATQAAFARRWRQKPRMVTGYADGTKLSFEQAIVANALGARVARRGMSAHRFGGHIEDAVDLYDVDELRSTGPIVDYVIGAHPAPGVFVFAGTDDPAHPEHLELLKLGPGPLYAFARPFHLCHLETPFSIARAALFDDATVAPLGAPCVEVVATAKTDLDPGTVLDGIGGFTVYGQCENAGTVAEERLLPIGVSEGCRVVRRVARDAVLRHDDVEVPPDRLVDRLRAEQAGM